MRVCGINSKSMKNMDARYERGGEKERGGRGEGDRREPKEAQRVEREGEINEEKRRRKKTGKSAGGGGGGRRGGGERAGRGGGGRE